MTGENSGRAEITHAHARSLQERALDMGKKFLILFLYLWILFVLFVLNERIILKQNGIDFAAHGFALLNAFVLAKVMMIAQELNLSRWLNRRPLIYPILHDSFVFAVIFIIFHVLEMLIVSEVRGEATAAAIPNIGGGGFLGIVCVAVIFFFALMPFFGFSHFNRILGRDRMHAILFGPMSQDPLKPV